MSRERAVVEAAAQMLSFTWLEVRDLARQLLAEEKPRRVEAVGQTQLFEDNQ